mmetsp:Transcript_52882/g.146442  ORF Transcript_52882/g.146442 Transcript_52882/m.146442 type:complete len:133 (+) Transcript_52882:54-452(+)
MALCDPNSSKCHNCADISGYNCAVITYSYFWTSVGDIETAIVGNRSPNTHCSVHLSCSFMFPVNPSSTQVDRIMRKSENAQWLGLRCLYISGSLLSWIVGGSRTFFIASLLLTAFFRSIDQAPKAISNEEPL